MPSRDRERLAGRPSSRRAARRSSVARDARRATGVVKTADHELALEARRERLVGIAELGERPLDDVHRVDPPKQGRVRLGDLERELGAFPRIVGEPQRLLQVRARGLAPGARPPRGPSRAGAPTRCGGGRRLGQRAAQQVSGGPRRSVLDRRARGLPQAGQHPLIARGTDTGEMRCDLSCRGAIGVQQPGGGAVRGVALVARRATPRRQRGRPGG